MTAWLTLTSLLVGNANATDIVYVWGGGSIERLEGTIVSEAPGGTLRLRTSDGREIEIPPQAVANVVRDPNSSDSDTLRSGLTSPESADAPRGATVPPPRYREPSVAFLCSLLVPGGGQFYNGQGGAGAFLLAGALVGVVLVANANPYAADFDQNVTGTYFARLERGTVKVVSRLVLIR
jgi:TM2 domain-containing membrane protein YozV